VKLAVLLLGTALAASASVIADQSALNGNSFDITDYRLADDFTPSATANLSQVRFWYQAQEQTDLTSVSYAVYADSGGAPGALLDSGTVAGPATGYDDASGLFTADFAVSPLLVSAGTSYWLELHAGTSLTDTSGLTISWAATADNATAIALQNLALATPDTPVGVAGFDQYSFVLGVSDVPEPSTAPMLAAILLGAAPAFRRRAMQLVLTRRRKK